MQPRKAPARRVRLGGDLHNVHACRQLARRQHRERPPHFAHPAIVERNSLHHDVDGNPQRLHGHSVRRKCVGGARSIIHRAPVRSRDPLLPCPALWKLIPLADARTVLRARHDALVRDAASTAPGHGRATRRHARPRARRPAHLGHRPLQFPLRLLHAEGCVRRATTRSCRTTQLLTFEEIARVARVFVGLGVRQDPAHRRRAAAAPQHRAADRDAARAFRDIDLTLTTNGALLARKARALRDAGLKRVTVSLDSLDDATFRAMNDVDFPVAQGARGHRRRGRGGPRADQDQHGGEARRERARDRADGAALPRHAATSCASSSTWTSAPPTAGAWTTSCPRARSCARSTREMPLDAADPNYARRGRRALALQRRQRRDRRHRVGDAGVLPRLHARAAVDRRQALHLPLRQRRLRPARAVARAAPTTTQLGRAIARDLARSAATAIRRSARRTRRARRRSRCRTSADERARRLLRRAGSRRSVEPDPTIRPNSLPPLHRRRAPGDLRRRRRSTSTAVLATCRSPASIR